MAGVPRKRTRFEKIMFESCHGLLIRALKDHQRPARHQTIWLPVFPFSSLIDAGFPCNLFPPNFREGDVINRNTFSTRKISTGNLTLTLTSRMMKAPVNVQIKAQIYSYCTAVSYCGGGSSWPNVDDSMVDVLCSPRYLRFDLCRAIVRWL